MCFSLSKRNFAQSAKNKSPKKKPNRGEVLTMDIFIQSKESQCSTSGHCSLPVFQFIYTDDFGWHGWKRLLQDI